MKRKPYIKPALLTLRLEASETICLNSGGHQDWHTQLGGGDEEESILGGSTGDSGSSGGGSLPDAGSDGFIWID